jgi:DNA-directed RNA polymerase subunit M/transcription elongation factor TFIIS
MAINFQCPQCKKKLKAPDSAAGKTSPCPHCGNKVTCPEKIYDAEVVERSPQAEKPPGFNPYADLDEDKPNPVTQPTQAQESPSESRRPCPACGEMIVATAAKCRFCGEVFDATLKKVKKKKKSKSYGPDEEDLSTSEIVIAVLCSGIGCIAGLVWMIQGKPKGKKMFGISIVMIIVWTVIRLVVQQSVHN